MKHPVRASLALLSILGVQGCASAALGDAPSMCDEPAVEFTESQAIEHGGVRLSVPAELRTRPASFGSMHFARNDDRVAISSVLSSEMEGPASVGFPDGWDSEGYAPAGNCTATIRGYPVTIYTFHGRDGMLSVARWKQVTDARDLEIHVSARGRKDFERLRGVFWTVEPAVESAGQRPTT